MNNMAGNPVRLHFLDWLRVLAMFGVFFFHNARFYDSFSDWHVKNAATNVGASAFIAFMSQWMMPVFFLIAGAGVFYALKSRTPGRYLYERTLRLLIPLIFGMLVIVVPQAYYEAVSHGEQLGGYNVFQIYWLYLQTLPDFNTFHLWFLSDLFLFSLVTVPLFINWGSPAKSAFTRFASWLNRPWTLVILLVLLLGITDTLLYPTGYWGYRNGGWNIVAYLIFFLSGYLIIANPRIMEFITGLRWALLIAGVIIFPCAMLFFLDELADPVTHFGSGMYILAQFVQSLNTWCWLFAVLGLSARYLNKINRFLSYANEAVLPFYILHQTVIISIGYYVVQWHSGIGLKYFTITSTSFIGIMLLYELLVRRINVLRFLFGMRWRKKPQRI